MYSNWSPKPIEIQQHYHHCLYSFPVFVPSTFVTIFPIIICVGSLLILLSESSPSFETSTTLFVFPGVLPVPVTGAWMDLN